MSPFINQEAIISVCLTFAVILPRPDPNDFSLLGGSFSQPFRAGVLTLSSALVVRGYFTLPYGLFLVWACFENIGRNFLRMMVPYLLQCQLTTVINVTPGKNLKKYLYAIILMNSFALFARANEYFDQSYFWRILMFQDSLVGIIVIQTYSTYKQLMEARQDVLNSPSILLRSIIVLEYIQIAFSVLIFLFWVDGSKSLRNVIQQILIFLHATILNMIDEVQFKHEASRSTPGTTTTVEEDTDVRDA